MKHSSCALYALLSVFLVLAVFFFLATLGLGIYAIVNAGQVAACVDSDPTTSCSIQTNATQFNYWMAGATGTALLHSVLATIVLWLATELLKEKQLARKSHPLPKTFNDLKENGERKAAALATGAQGDIKEEDLPHRNEADETDGMLHRHVKVSIDVIGGEEVKEWQETTVRGFTPLAGVVLFFGILAAMCALVCMLWGIAISYNQFNPRLLTVTDDSTVKVNDFIIVNILIGMVAPIFLFVSTGLVAIVVDYITVGQLDMRKAICYILPSVTAQEGKENNYWTILDTFYFPLSKRPDRNKHGFLYSCDKSRYTWYFSIVCALSILLVFSYFVDITVTEEFASTSCPSDTTYVCFNQKNYLYINCSQALNSSVKSIICFKFLRFGVDVNLITALSQSFAFYLLITTFFAQIFTIVKALISIKPSRFWGIGLILFSFLLIGGAIAVLVESDVLVAYTGILSILEFFMEGFAVLVIGVLLVEGKWWEKIPPSEAKPIHFVQYDDTSRKKLEEIHHSVALEEEKGVEIEHNLIEPVLK